MTDATLPKGLPTPLVAALANVAPSTLHHWLKTGLCEATLVPTSGKRATAYWNIREVVIARTVATLRHAGCPLPVVRQVKQLLTDHWNTDLAGAVLFWDGRDVITIDDSGVLISLVRERGQAIVRSAVLHVATAPLSVWFDEVDGIAKPVDANDIILRRQSRKDLRGDGLPASLRRA